ncbi:ATP-dependent DNA ligase [Nocardiopsis sp. NPDC050513]|uniref:ATP-dependent DNA ligase n=1 Tax=Nocardiopsis sp. NPDC050513 TaxID=3364338 RepID=UPI0037AAE940
MDLPAPMLARTVTTMPVGPHLVYEPKWDGFRALAATRPGRLYSRTGRPTTRSWPELAEALDTLPEGLLLDGEIVRWSGRRLDFDALLRRNTASALRARRLARDEPAHFVAFDLLRDGGADIGRRSLGYRRRRLERVFADVADPHLALGWQTGDPATARVWFEDLADAGVEGLVVKDTRRAYRPGRRGWDKYKRRVTTEAVVGGFTREDPRSIALILGRRDDAGRLAVVGRTATLTPRQTREIVDRLRKATVSEHPWRPTLPAAWGGGERRTYTRVEPALVVEVAPDTAVSGGRWRHLVPYVRPRPELDVDDVPRGLDIETASG